MVVAGQEFVSVLIPCGITISNSSIVKRMGETK
jgi:hypothetical protein